MSGKPAFFEIGVPDAQRARAFYTTLLPWTFHPMEGEQGWLETPTIRGGLHDEDADARIVIYFEVPDIEAAVNRVRDLGGSADDPGADEPGFGRFASCRDDQGVIFGLVQSPSA